MPNGLTKTPTFATIHKDKKGKKPYASGVSGLGSNMCKLATKPNMSKEQYNQCTDFGRCSNHAETSAIRKFLHQKKGTKKDVLKGCTISVSRYTRSGDLALAKPCSGCILLIKLVGIKNVCYTTDDGWVTEKVRDIQCVPSSAARREKHI